MKVIKISIICAILIAIGGIANAQETSKKKIVVVEKITDNNGNVTTNKVVKEGEEAEMYMLEKKKELGVDKNVKHIEKEIEVEVINGEVKEKKKFVIKVEDDEGEEKILKWNGEGEMPDEMKEYMDEENLDIDVEDTDDGEVRVIVRTTDKKPRLGIVPENHVDGVEVIEVLEGSAAEKAGLMKGDIIYEIAGKLIGSTLQLNAGLDRVEEGGTTTVHLLRNGVKEMVQVKL